MPTSRNAARISPDSTGKAIQTIEHTEDIAGVDTAVEAQVVALMEGRTGVTDVSNRDLLVQLVHIRHLMGEATQMLSIIAGAITDVDMEPEE